MATRFTEQALAEAMQTPWPMLADISPAGTIIEEGRPILTLFANGVESSEVEQNLRAKADAIYEQLDAEKSLH
jgi:predicted ATP-grasp superfamily ATP-dependent carboligase